MSKNNRFIYQKRNGIFKRRLFLIVFIIILIVPVIILSTSREPKIKFFAYIICYGFWTIITFLIGLLCIFMKIDKDEGFVRMARVKITGIAFLVFSILFIMPTYSYCRDIPVIISSEYSCFEGDLTNFHFTVGRSTSTILVFKDKTFKIDHKVSPQFMVIGKKYYIEFLWWMKRKHPQNPWERYADDAVIHCWTEEEAKALLVELNERMTECKLEVHPGKTKIVYCKSDVYPEHHEHDSFDFLGYTFRRRIVKSRHGNFFNGFTPAVSKGASQHLRDSIREIRRKHKIASLEELAERMNPVLRGWMNYFCKYSAGEARNVLNYVNLTLIQCIRYKYKSTGRKHLKSHKLLGRICKEQPNLFYHWQMGLRPSVG